MQKKRLELQQLLDNTRPNQARVDGVKGDIQRLEALVAKLRSQLTASDRRQHLAGADHRRSCGLAETDLQTRQAMMAAGAGAA